MKLTSTEILKNKEEFIRLLRSTNRPGIEDLITWFEEKSDFFEAPSSSKFHGCYEGGLCQHSLNVYHALKQLIEYNNSIALPEKHLKDIGEDTLIISALLHDLCKTNFYQKETRVFKDDTTGIWHHYYTYKCEDGFPLGHGEKSVIMAQYFIKLTGTECLAIRWHMGIADIGAHMSAYEAPAMNKASNECPLVILLQEADYFASYMMEYTVDPKVENLID